MLFFLGCLCGVGIALAMRGVLLAVGLRCGVEKPKRSVRSTHQKWEQTRNFLYYDGTVMPTNKEEQNE